jgi:hypothetical protein
MVGDTKYVNSNHVLVLIDAGAFEDVLDILW